jgi:hypothetical protein
MAINSMKWSIYCYIGLEIVIRKILHCNVDVLTTFYRINEIQMTISTLLHAIISILKYCIAMTSQILIAFIKFPMTGK